jgi:biopolymer transport protein ExbD
MHTTRGNISLRENVMSRFYAVPHEDQTEINLSPMLDMVFILLIFFIVVASFVDEDVLPAAIG